MSVDKESSEITLNDTRKTAVDPKLCRS